MFFSKFFKGCRIRSTGPCHAKRDAALLGQITDGCDTAQDGGVLLVEEHEWKDKCTVLPEDEAYQYVLRQVRQVHHGSKSIMIINYFVSIFAGHGT
jgi:hypothetical protein